MLWFFILYYHLNKAVWPRIWKTFVDFLKQGPVPYIPYKSPLNYLRNLCIFTEICAYLQHLENNPKGHITSKQPCIQYTVAASIQKEFNVSKMWALGCTRPHLYLFKEFYTGDCGRSYFYQILNSFWVQTTSNLPLTTTNQTPLEKLSICILQTLK